MAEERDQGMSERRRPTLKEQREACPPYSPCYHNNWVPAALRERRELQRSAMKSLAKVLSNSPSWLAPVIDRLLDAEYATAPEPVTTGDTMSGATPTMRGRKPKPTPDHEAQIERSIRRMHEPRALEERVAELERACEPSTRQWRALIELEELVRGQLSMLAERVARLEQRGWDDGK